jgi:hypothetical protein
MEAGLVNERTGIAMMAIGGLIAIIGLVWLLMGDFNDPVAASAPLTSIVTDTTVATTQAPPQTTTTAPVATTTAAPTTTAVPTTTVAPTTTTTVPDETVAEFLVAYRVALDADDLEFLVDRLHPVVKDSFGEQLCQDFVAREIAALENYEATAEPGAPVPRSILGTSVQMYEVPIAFDFQGQHFEAVGTFALVDGRVHYFAECR